MIENKESKRSLVIPKWLPCEQSIKSRDYGIPRLESFVHHKKTISMFNEDYESFKRSSNNIVASDLMASAITLNFPDIAREIATVILENDKSNRISINLARNLVSTDENDPKKIEYNQKLREIRTFLHKYPRNPILWVELARLYTIKGLNKKAENAILTALNLTPIDRFVVRAGFRFFLHIREFDKALYYIKKASALSNDPLIKASEINLAILRELQILKFRKLNLRTISNTSRYYYSELFETYGLLELKAGNIKRAKKIFQMAWSDPNENVITHGEWVIRNYLPQLQDQSGLDYTKSVVALTWQHYYSFEFSKALENVRDWILQEPYSTHPFVCGSSIACYAGNPKLGAEIAIEGTQANRNDLVLKNNLAFAYLNMGDLRKAETELKSFPKSLNQLESILYFATTGLLYFKKGIPDKGRDLYMRSFELSKKADDKRLSAKVLLHLAKAELEARTDVACETSRSALHISRNDTYPDTVLLRKRVKELARHL